MSVDPDIIPLLEEKQEQITELKTSVVEQSQQIAGLAESSRDILVGLDEVKTRLTVLENTTVPTPPDPEPEPWVPRFPGDVELGTIRWGCSHQANTIPVTHEEAAGVPVGNRRTFWRIDQIDKIVSTCLQDITAGRVPWVSVKLNRLATWLETANGKIDTQILDLIYKLGALPGPVWLTMHHEPEGGNGTPYPDEGQGSEAHWRAMQEHTRALLDRSEVTNIALVPVLMAWTFDARSNRNPLDYWVDGIWDFVGLDNYVEASAVSVRTIGWNNALGFYEARSMPIGVGEWGNKDHGATGALEMQDWYDHLISIHSPGACYFDTNLNGGVPLSGAVLDKFRELMVAPTSVTLL